MKELRKRDMDVYRKSILVRGTASAETLAQAVPSVFRKGQEGQYSWNGVSGGMEGRDVF